MVRVLALWVLLPLLPAQPSLLTLVLVLATVQAPAMVQGTALLSDQGVCDRNNAQNSHPSFFSIPSWCSQALGTAALGYPPGYHFGWPLPVWLRLSFVP